MRSVSTTGLARMLSAVGLCLGVGFGVAAPALAAEPGAQLEQRVRRLENIIDSGQLASLIQQINALTAEIRELRGQIETQGHRLDQLRQRQRNLYGDLDRRLRALEVRAQDAAERQRPADESDSGDGAANAGGAPSGGGVAEPDTAGDSAASKQVPLAEQQAAYNAAFDLLKEGRYREAVTAFEGVVEDYPNGPFADNALYWLGESHYVTRDFEAALASFREVVEDYPESTKAGDARLKIGYTLYELQRYDEATAVLQQVVDEHANSSVARLAEERLLRIERAK